MLMKNLPFLLVLLFSNLLLSETAKWEVELDDHSVSVVINGNNSWGDRYRIVLNPGTENDGCNLTEQFTTNYSVVDDIAEKYENLPSDYVLSKIKTGDREEKFLMKILFTRDFLLGKITFFVVGGNLIEDFLDFHKESENFSIELLAFYDLENQQEYDVDISKYYDITKNSWNLIGLRDALYEGKEECLKLVP